MGNKVPEKLIITKYDKKKNYLECTCSPNAQVLAEGEVTYKQPLGLGFHDGERKFAIDFIEYKGWYGTCLECKKTVLGYKSKKLVTKYPKSINDKIKRGGK